MADQMVCEQCGTLLHLRDIISEKLYGLASVFTMLCRSCHTIRKISSGKRDGCGGFEINYKVTIDNPKTKKKKKKKDKEEEEIFLKQNSVPWRP
uniref:Uncharacterized protein n=1 Tax=Magallana gigas TaxID=29159 RepID=K1QKJ8_MAGGI